MDAETLLSAMREANLPEPKVSLSNDGTKIRSIIETTTLQGKRAAFAMETLASKLGGDDIKRIVAVHQRWLQDINDPSPEGGTAYGR